MKSRTLLQAAAGLALAAGAYLYLSRGDGRAPPTMRPDGEATREGWIVRQKTIDYEAIIKSSLAEKASFLTLTLAKDVVRDQHLETSIKYTPFPASTARVRVKYRVEYPIGYVLSPGSFAVSGGADGLVITLRRPQLIARPSVKLQSFKVLESGILIDEKTALLELQQRIQPDAEKRAAEILRQADVIPRSERVLRGFLQSILRQQAGTAAPPPITFAYR